MEADARSPGIVQPQHPPLAAIFDSATGNGEWKLISWGSFANWSLTWRRQRLILTLEGAGGVDRVEAVVVDGARGQPT